MAEPLLRQWLLEVAGLQAGASLEQEFANGYLLGQLLHSLGLQPHVSGFTNSARPDACLANYSQLQPALSKLGVRLDSRTAQGLINKQRGLAGQVLYSIKQALASMDKDAQLLAHLQALGHAGRTMQQFSVRTAPTRGVLDSQHHKSQRAAFESSNLKVLEGVLRKHAVSPKRVREALHLQHFSDEAARQAAAAADGAAVEAAGQAGDRAALRSSLRGQLAAGRSDRHAKLQRDEAVHAAILKYQDELERQELHVELAMSQLKHARQQEQAAAAAADAAAGIDAFEMTLTRLDGEPADGDAGATEQAPPARESAMATLGRIRGFAPTAARLAEGSGEYLAAIRGRRQEEQAARKAREVRRRKLLAEQQAAREAAESRAETEVLLGVLSRCSGEEQQLARRLDHIRQEKAAIDADTRLRDEQYAARREQDAQQALQREALLHRSLAAQHEAAARLEAAAWQQKRQARAAAEAAATQAFAGEVAWQLVQLAERLIAFRAATAGQQVPRSEWRAWVALFCAGDPALGRPATSGIAAAFTSSAAGPVAASEPESSQQVVAMAELQEYLQNRGDWALTEGLVQPPACSSNASSSGSNAGLSVSQQHAALGRVVAQLAALTQKQQQQHPEQPAAAAESSTPDAPAAAAGDSVPTSAILACPLKLCVAGSPCAGKTKVAQALAAKFGLKLLVPERLLADAVAAAQAWQKQQEQEQQQAQPEQQQAPSRQAALGQQALLELQAGSTLSDQLLVELLLLGMREATQHKADVAELPATEAKAPRGPPVTPKGGGAPATKAGSPGSAVPPAAAGPAAAAASSSGGGTAASLLLPPHLAAGMTGRGFVVDGFPATAAQAALLEKALTGLDLDAERALLQGASLIAPAPSDVLPQLERPRESGLDAVLVLGCEDASVAVRRALGRRLDPVTGQVYHMDYQPPPTNVPGLVERLVMPPDAEAAAQQMPARLAAYTAAEAPLAGWLARFRTLRKPLDGGVELHEVLAAAADVASGILSAKAAAHAASVAAQAAARAKEAGDKARSHVRAAQCHAEGAARELLAAKKAEIQAAALLNSGKNPDPASAEVLKAQAAAKCADQLKACRLAATEAASHAERGSSAADAALAAVQRCKLAVGDAAVSNEAANAATKAAADAEAAAAAAVEAARKADASKQLAQGYVAEAEKWFAAAEVPADAALLPAEQVAAGMALSAADSSTEAAPASSVGAGSATPPPGAAKVLPPAAALPAAAVALLYAEWQLLESAYVQGMCRGLSGVRQARQLLLGHVATSCSWFADLLKQPDGKQALLAAFVERFNAVEPDMRKARETQAELLLRCEELRDALWGVCDAKQEEAEAARQKVVASGVAAQHIALLGQHFTSLVQVELDRYLATCQFLYSLCHYAAGIMQPPGAEKLQWSAPSLLATTTGEPGKADAAAARGGTQPAYLASLQQQRLWQLVAALRTAATTATAAHAAALSVLEEAGKKAAAAASAAAATASAAAAAAAAASGAPPTAGAHKPAAPAAAKAAATGVAKGVAAGAAASSRLAASSEEAAALAAAAAAAAAALPDPAALAAVAAQLQASLGQELFLLQQRLALLGSRAAASVEELTQLHGTALSQMAAWQQRRYVAECGAVAALERLVKEAAMAGQPLHHDLRLRDEVLIVDEGKLLVPLPQPAPLPPSPTGVPVPPPGVLTMQQLQQLAAALQQAAPCGLLAVCDATDLMLRMASQGVLPGAWRTIDATHMASALAGLDPTFSGYLDWRQLLLSLVAAAVPALHTASPTQVAAQAAQLAATDGDGDGCLTRAEFECVRWWFDAPAAAEVADAAEAAWQAERCSQLKRLLWEVFQQPADAAAAAGDNAAQDAPAGTDSAAVVPAAVVPWAALLLHLCADQDLAAGVSKAVAAVARSASPAATVDAAGVSLLCYPLLTAEQVAPMQRAPLSGAQIAAAVAAAAAEANRTAAAAAAPPQQQAPASRASAGGGAAVQPPAAPAGAPEIKVAQLLYSAPCERLVALLLCRYQLSDVFIAAQL